MGQPPLGGQVFSPLFPASVARAWPISGSQGSGGSLFCMTLGGWLEWRRKGGHKSHWLKSLEMEG